MTGHNYCVLTNDWKVKHPIVCSSQFMDSHIRTYCTHTHELISAEKFSGFSGGGIKKIHLYGKYESYLAFTFL